MSDKLAAFAARGDEPIAGTVAVGDGDSFDVGEALEDGGGTIVVVAGSKLEHSLNGYGALKPAEVPDGAEAVNADDAAGEAVEVNATDAAIRKAAELEVNLDELEGTGAGGKITVDDIEKAAESAASSAAAGDGKDGS